MMRIKWRYLLVSLIPLLVTLFSALLPFYSVSAASVYDDVIYKSPNLLLLNTYPGQEHSEDITSTYLTFMEDYCSSGTADSLINAVNSVDEGGKWAIVNNRIDPDVPNHLSSVSIAWTISDTEQTEWSTSGGVRIAKVFGTKVVQLFYSNLGTGAAPHCFESDNSYLTIGDSQTTPPVGTYVWVSTYPPNYPEGYSGTPIPETNSPPVSIKPKLYYSVTDKKIHANPLSALSVELQPYIPVWGGSGYISYSLIKCTDSTYTDCSPVNLGNNIIETSPYDFTVTDYGYYLITAQYTWPSPVPEPTPPDGVTFSWDIVSIQMYVNGTTFDGSVLDQDCNIEAGNTLCPQKTPYKDCFALYGGEFPFGFFGGEFPNIISGFSCVIDNFGVFIRVLLTQLFGPQAIADFSRSLKEFSTNTYGLTAVVTSPITLLENIRDATYGCATIEIPLPYLDRTLALPCMTAFYANFGAAFTLYQTIVTGVVGYYVIVGMLNSVKGFKDPEDDRIEVMKL